MDTYHDALRQQLLQHYAGRLQEAKQKRIRDALVSLVAFLVLAAIALAVNILFQMQGEPFVALVPVFLVWFFVFYRFSASHSDIAQLQWIVQCLGGIPTEAAWHLFRIGMVKMDSRCPLDQNARTRWLLYDTDLFLKRFPESIAPRFGKAELCLAFGWTDDAIEALDRIIEKDGAGLKDAYLGRADLLEANDPAAARRDREKWAELEKTRKNLPAKAAIDMVNPLDFRLAVEPIPPFFTRKDAQCLIDQGRFEEALVGAVNMELGLFDLVAIYTLVAEKLFEKNDQGQAAKVLVQAIDLVFHETEYKSSRGRHLATLALSQGRLFGKEAARKTLEMALAENSQARKPASRLSAFRDIIKVQLLLALFDEAETAIRNLGDEDMKLYLLIDLADALQQNGNAAKAELLRKEADQKIPRDDEDYPPIPLLLHIAESYAKADRRESALERLRRAMEQVEFVESDFHDVMADVTTAYYNCGMLRELKEDIQRYAHEDIEAYLEGIDEELAK